MNTINRCVKRVRQSCDLPPDVLRHLKRVGPLLMIASVLVYLLLGAAAFLSLEHSVHEHEISRFYLNFGVRRRQFSREMTKALFEKNENMLIIVDQANTQRLQDVLNKQLRDYENELPLELPNRQAWTMTNSLNFAWGLFDNVGSWQSISGDHWRTNLRTFLRTFGHSVLLQYDPHLCVFGFTLDSRQRSFSR
ncbi:hypothetical protein M3Y94_01033300 [Aphelenchoides besseyi]|nr:hypothetical protein M3Y94_01033300 [Aphelenchoides besseyi]